MSGGAFLSNNQRPTEDFDLDVARGAVPGASSFSRFGFNKNLTAAAGEEIVAAFGGTLTIQTAPTTIQVTFANANDDAAGSGMRSFAMIGVGADGSTQQAVYSTNGSSFVTSEQWLGINRCIGLTWGAGGTNAGTVSFTSTADASNQAQIPAGYGVTQQLFHHVATDRVAYFERLVLDLFRAASGGGDVAADVRGYLFNRATGGTVNLFDTKLNTAYRPSIDSLLKNPVNLGSNVVWYFTADADTNATAIRGRGEQKLFTTS